MKDDKRNNKEIKEFAENSAAKLSDDELNGVSGGCVFVGNIPDRKNLLKPQYNIPGSNNNPTSGSL